jgi:hypothetical protein
MRRSSVVTVLGEICSNLARSLSLSTLQQTHFQVSGTFFRDHGPLSIDVATSPKTGTDKGAYHRLKMLAVDLTAARELCRSCGASSLMGIDFWLLNSRIGFWVPAGGSCHCLGSCIP